MLGLNDVGLFIMDEKYYFSYKIKEPLKNENTYVL